MFEKEVFNKIRQCEEESHTLLPYYESVDLYFYNVDKEKLKKLIDSYYGKYKIDKNSYKVLSTWIEIKDDYVLIYAR